MNIQKILRGKKYLVLIAAVVIGLVGVTVYFHLSVGSGGGEEARFVVENVSVTGSAEIGENIPVNVTVVNVGGVEGRHKLVLRVDNQREKSRRVRLGPGEKSEVSFTFSRSEPDNYLVEVPGFGGKLVSLYVVEPWGPEEPLFRVGWYLEPSLSSDSENAPTRLSVAASASTGVKMEFYRVREGVLVPVENEWWAATEVDDEKLTTVVGRGTPETQGFALIVKGPSRKILYRGYREYRAGKAEVEVFSVYREARRENCEYSIREVTGEVRGDLPVFVADGEVRIDGRSVDSELTYEGYLSGGRFPSLLIRSKVEEGPHQVKISFFNERGEKIDSVENRKVFG